MSASDQIQKKLYRAGMIGGGVLFGLTFLEPVLAAVSPFLPLIASVLTGLITGMVVKGIFNFAVNKKLNQSYRYSENGASASGASSTKQTPKTKQRAKQAPPRQEPPPPPPPPPPDLRVMYRKILGLGEQYTADELKAAYRDSAAKFHPDHYVNASENKRRHAEEMMKNINEAYHALSK